MERQVPEAPDLPMAGIDVDANARSGSGQFASGDALGDLSVSDAGRGYKTLPDAQGSGQPEYVMGAMIRL